MKRILLFPALLAAGLLTAADWHTALSLDNGGWWNRRIPLRIANTGDRPLAGETVRIPAGQAVGAAVESLRLVREDGAELLWALHDRDGLPITCGRVPEHSTLSIPVDCAPKTQTTYYLYFGNPQAWRVPEYLYEGIPQLNGDLEDGNWTMPENWQRRGQDAAHRLIRDDSVARSGHKSLRAEVDTGERPSWFAAFFDRIPVRPGEQYSVSAWTRGDNVRGVAGWYVHVLDRQGKFVLNKLIEAGDGTFDWKRGTLEFTVPENGVKAVVGTVLHGTGTAWFDLISVTRRSLPVRVEPQPAETRTLHRIGADAPWIAGKEWFCRAPLTVRNPDRAQSTRRYSFDLRPLKNQAAKLLGFTAGTRWLLVDPQSPKEAREMAGTLGDDLNLEFTLPAETEKTVWLYLDRTPQPRRAAVHEEVPYLPAPRNLLAERNGNMEEGDGPRPTFWSAGEEGKADSGKFTAERVRGGVNGDWCLKLHVPASVARPGWVGWRQRIPVKPNTTYVYTGYIRNENTDTSIMLHGHYLDKAGRMIDAFFGRVDGTLLNNINDDWTYYNPPFTTPAGCTTIEVHLTMNGHGTIWHDAVSISELEQSGVAGPLQPRQPQKGLSVWSEPAVVKTFRHDIRPPRAAAYARISSPRNSVEALQLALRSPQGGKVMIAVTPPVNEQGNALPSPVLFRTGFVPIDQPGGTMTTAQPPWLRLTGVTRNTDGWSGLWPDPLIPVRDGRFEIAAGVTEGLIFDFPVPRDAAPGLYRTEIRVALGKEAAVFPVEVKVWKFVRPDRLKTPALFEATRPKVYGLSDDNAVFATMKFLAAYGVSPGVIPYSFQPVFRRQEGRITMDTERFDRLASYLFDELQVDKIWTPGHFYAGGWSSGISPMFGIRFGTPEFDRVWRESYRLFVDHITARGWRDRFLYYLTDEPHQSSEAMMTGMVHLAKLAREIAPDIPVYSSTWVHMPELDGALSMWGIGENGRFTPEKIAERRKAGDRFMFTTDGHFGIDTPLAGVERLLPLLGFKYGVEGFEFWSTDHYTFNPWEYGWCRDITQSLDGGKTWSRFRFSNGDGYILYPGRDLGLAEPVPSLRLLYTRMGLFDNELFHRLAQFEAEGNPEAKAALDGIRRFAAIPTYPNRSTSLYLGDPAGFLQARDAAGETLDRLEKH